MADQSEFVNFLVSGRAYSLSMSDIRKFPGSYFSAAVKKEWCGGQTGGFVEINRDGDVFQYIVDFHFYGELPVTGKRMSVETLQQIQAEADFFNIPELVNACESVLIAGDGLQLAPDAAKCAAIVSSIDAHFAKFDTVVVCLTHLYPLCQADPASLKGGDVSLYAILQDANKYDLSVVPISVEHVVGAEYGADSSISADLIDVEFESCPKTKKRAVKEKVVLIIPTCCDSGQFLTRKEYGKRVRTQYLTTGLSVTKRAE